MKKFIVSSLMLFSSVAFAKEKINDLVLKDLSNDKIVTVGDLKGKTYIKVWASWCPVCLSTLPEFNELSGKKNLDFNVISVVSPKTYNEVSEEKFKNWWDGLKADYKNVKVLADNSAILIRKARIRAYPTNVFINSKGEIEKVQPGAMSTNDIINIMKTIN